MGEPIGFGKRLGAYVIDWVAILLVGNMAGAMLGGVLGLGVGAAVGTAAGNPAGTAAGGALGGFFGALAGAVAGVYLLSIAFAIWEAITGAALGKLILGIRIKAADGSPASPGMLVGRAAIKRSGALIGLLAIVSQSSALQGLGTLASIAILIGCFFVLGQSRQAIHDMIVKTAVYAD